MKLCFPVEKNDGLQSKVAGHFGSAPLLLVVDTQTQELVELKQSGQAQQPGRARLAQLLAGQPDALVASSIGQGAHSKLLAAGVKIYLAAGATISDNLLCLADRRLTELDAKRLCLHGHGAGHGHAKGHSHGHGAGQGCGCR